MIEHRLFVHDMRNLLGIIHGYTGLLLEEMPTDETRRADIVEIRKASEDALARLDAWFTSTIDSKGESPK